MCQFNHEIRLDSDDYRMNAEPALWLVYPKSNVLTAKVRVFIDFLVDRIGANPP